MTISHKYLFLYRSGNDWSLTFAWPRGGVNKDEVTDSANQELDKFSNAALLTGVVKWALSFVSRRRWDGTAREGGEETGEWGEKGW